MFESVVFKTFYHGILYSPLNTHHLKKYVCVIFISNHLKLHNIFVAETAVTLHPSPCSTNNHDGETTVGKEGKAMPRWCRWCDANRPRGIPWCIERCWALWRSSSCSVPWGFSGLRKNFWSKATTLPDKLTAFSTWKWMVGRWNVPIGIWAIFRGYVSFRECSGSWRDPLKWYLFMVQKSGINSPVEGTVVEIPLFNKVLAPYQVGCLGCLNQTTVVAHDTPPKINIEPEVMMVWFRWFSFSNWGYSQVNHVNLPGCNPFMIE